MLRLLYAIPCENVIAAIGGQHSIIGVLERATAELPANAPAKLLMPMKWTVVTLWTRDDNPVPEPIKYEQRTVVKTPEGDEIFRLDLPFSISEGFRNYRNTANFNGFPISSTGIATVEVSLREANSEEWIQHQTFPIGVERITLEVNADEANETNHPVNAGASIS